MPDDVFATMARRLGDISFDEISDNRGAIIGNAVNSTIIGSQNNTYYQTETSRAEASPSPAATIIPFPRDDNFVDILASEESKSNAGGVKTILDVIEEKCVKPASRVALVGFGGVGKSQVAIEYCHRLRQRLPNLWIFWIYASNTARVKEGYFGIADAVQDSGRIDSQADIFDLVKRWLQNEKNGPWLVVLDSADDDEILTLQEVRRLSATSPRPSGRIRRLTDYLPWSPHGTVIVTTRSIEVAEQLVEHRNIVRIEPMALDEATELLRRKIDAYDERSNLDELAKVLECIPLALVQAAAYINKRGIRYSVREYISDFQKSDKRASSRLELAAGNLRRDQEATNLVLVTWQISFEYIHMHWPSSADLLSLMSFFDRQGIPEHVLKARGWTKNTEQRVGIRDEDNESESDIADGFEEDLERLRGYSFVSTGVDRCSFNMHRLVQLATRRWLSQHKKDRHWRAIFLDKLFAVWPTLESAQNPQALFPHAKAAQRQCPHPGEGDEVVWKWASIIQKAARYALERGYLSDAKAMCESSATAFESLSHPAEADSAHSNELLASTYRDQGRFQEAETLGTQVWESYEKLLGEWHPLTLTSMTSLAITYSAQGLWGKAEPLFKHLVKTERTLFGDDHPRTLATIAHLALMYQDQGRWKEAQPIFMELVDTLKTVRGGEHPDTLSAMGNLATNFQVHGQLKQAEEMQVQIVVLTKRKWGDKHPVTLTNMANLATTYWRQERWEEAEELDREVMETRKKELGEEHPLTLSSMNNIAFLLKQQGRVEEAIKLLATCQRLCIKVLGPAHYHCQDITRAMTAWQRDQEAKY